MTRSKGDHLKWNEVKAGIIEFVMIRNEAVPEPDIRKHLGEKYGITDQKNIKKHLSDLKRQPNSCIEKIRPKPGFANNWEIRRIEHVRNIRLHFPEIQLKTYEKPLKIVLKRFYPIHSDSPMANKFRVQLLLSDSFFDMCTKTDPETIYDKAYKLYKHSFDKWGKEHPEWEQRVLEDMSRERAVGIYTEIMKGMSQFSIPIEAEVLKTAFETAAKKIKDEESELMSYWYQWDESGEAFEMKLPLYIGSVLIEKIFYHCFERDITDGTVSPEEIEFVNKTREMRVYYKANPEIRLFSELKAYDDFYIQYFEKFRAKTETP